MFASFEDVIAVFATGVEPTGVEPTGVEPTGVDPTGADPSWPETSARRTDDESSMPLQLPPSVGSAGVGAVHHPVKAGSGVSRAGSGTAESGVLPATIVDQWTERKSVVDRSAWLNHNALKCCSEVMPSLHVSVEFSRSRSVSDCGGWSTSVP